MIGDPGTEHHRTRVGFLFLAVGVLLLLWAWGSWFYRTKVPEAVPAAAQAGHQRIRAAQPGAGAAADREKVVRALPGLLLLGAVLVLVFLFGTYAFLRFSRRYRLLIELRRPPPSDSRDLWAMHQVPTYDDDDEFS